MLYTTFTVKDTDYKLRLGAKSCVDLEKKLGTNPVNVLVAIAEQNKVPSLSTLLTIIHASMVQYQHGITMDKVYEIYEDYAEEGHNMLELVPVIMEIFKNAGLIPDEDEEGKN